VDGGARRGGRKREEHRAEVACARNEVEINANLREEPGHKAPKERRGSVGERAHGEILAKGRRTDGRTDGRTRRSRSSVEGRREGGSGRSRCREREKEREREEREDEEAARRPAMAAWPAD